MERTGTVISIRNDIAVVKCSGACPGECKGCAVGHMFGSRENGSPDIEALNNAGAQVGDTVKIELDTRSSLIAYGIAYGIPMLGLLIGAIAGHYAGRFLKMNENLIIFLFIIACVGGAFGLVYLLGDKFKGVPSVTKIISNKNSANQK